MCCFLSSYCPDVFSISLSSIGDFKVHILDFLKAIDRIILLLQHLINILFMCSMQIYIHPWSDSQVVAESYIIFGLSILENVTVNCLSMLFLSWITRRIISIDFHNNWYLECFYAVTHYLVSLSTMRINPRPKACKMVCSINIIRCHYQPLNAILSSVVIVNNYINRRCCS